MQSCSEVYIFLHTKVILETNLNTGLSAKRDTIPSRFQSNVQENLLKFETNLCNVYLIRKQ